MNTKNNETTFNNEQELHSEESKTPKTPSAKDRVMEDGKLTFLEFLYVARYFLPVLTTIGWIIPCSRMESASSSILSSLKVFLG